MTPPPPPAVHPGAADRWARLYPPGRLAGIDAARGIALFAMIITHVFPLMNGDEPTWAAQFSGRASALFAVLAGVSLVLSTRAAVTSGDRTALQAARVTVFVRGAGIVVIGLTLATLGGMLAVILVNYGVIFFCAAFLITLRARTLGLLGAAWFLLTPLLSAWLRTSLDLQPQFVNPNWFDLFRPLALLQDLFLTGYYPVLQWFGYVVVGMFLAKLDLRRHRVALIAWGTALAVLTKVVSNLLLDREVRALLRPEAEGGAANFDEILHAGAYGVTPAGSWWWMVVAGPHTATPVDLLHTAGVAAAVIGVCLWLADRLGPLLLPLTAPGSMPLTIYAGHVVAYHIIVLLPVAEAVAFACHALAAVAFAVFWKAVVGPQGPAEWVLGRIAGAARARVLTRG